MCPAGHGLDAEHGAGVPRLARSRYTSGTSSVSTPLLRHWRHVEAGQDNLGQHCPRSRGPCAALAGADVTLTLFWALECCSARCFRWELTSRWPWLGRARAELCRGGPEPL
jgi:hypothetical protein